MADLAVSNAPTTTELEKLKSKAVEETKKESGEAEPTMTVSNNTVGDKTADVSADVATDNLAALNKSNIEVVTPDSTKPADTEAETEAPAKGRVKSMEAPVSGRFGETYRELLEEEFADQLTLEEINQLVQSRGDVADLSLKERLLLSEFGDVRNGPSPDGDSVTLTPLGVQWHPEANEGFEREDEGQQPMTEWPILTGPDGRLTPGQEKELETRRVIHNVRNIQNDQNLTDEQKATVEFDRNYYLQTYTDVAAAGVDPFQHFLDFGIKEGRNPNPNFNQDAYVNAHGDLLEAGVNGFEHWIQHGIYEGRALG